MHPSSALDRGEREVKPVLVRFQLFFAIVFLLGVSGLLLAQDPAPAPAKKGKADAQAQSDVDPLKRPMSEKQRKESEKSFKQELSREFKKWLDEEVRWII